MKPAGCLLLVIILMKFSAILSAVGLSSGTAAMHMAVRLAEIHPCEKIFCSDLNFTASVNPVIHEGGIPVFTHECYIIGRAQLCTKCYYKILESRPGNAENT